MQCPRCGSNWLPTASAWCLPCSFVRYMPSAVAIPRSVFPWMRVSVPGSLVAQRYGRELLRRHLRAPVRLPPALDEGALPVVVEPVRHRVRGPLPESLYPAPLQYRAQHRPELHEVALPLLTPHCLRPRVHPMLQPAPSPPSDTSPGASGPAPRSRRGRCGSPGPASRRRAVSAAPAPPPPW